MTTTSIGPSDIEKAEQYLFDLKDALEYHRDLPSLDDFQYYCQIAVSCAERLNSLPRDFWDSISTDGLIVTEKRKLYVVNEVRDYGRMGEILTSAVGTANTLRIYFEGLVEGRYSGNQFYFLDDFAEELRRYVKTYDDLHRCGII